MKTGLNTEVEVLPTFTKSYLFSTQELSNHDIHRQDVCWLLLKVTMEDTSLLLQFFLNLNVA